MSQGIRQHRSLGTSFVHNREADTIQKSTITLREANQVIASTKSYSSGMSFEVANLAANLSGSATVNIQMSVSGTNWVQAVDANGNNFTYTLTSGGVVIDAITGIPEGTPLRIVVVENLTGTLEIATRF